MKVAMLMAFMTALLTMVGRVLGGPQGMMWMFVISIAMNFYYYWNSDKMVLSRYKANEVSRNNVPELYDMVDQLAAKAGLPTPRIYIIDSAVPNAFATGRDPEHAAVAINKGLIDVLDRDEIEGVLSHELSHIKNRDILISTIAGSMAGLITNIAHFALIFGGDRNDSNRNPIASLLLLILAPLAASMIQLSISRSREYDADALGGEISGKPEALASALMKIEAFAKRGVMKNASEATAHMFIINPFSAKDLKSLFSTHPSTEERVKRLKEQARKMGRAV